MFDNKSLFSGMKFLRKWIDIEIAIDTLSWLENCFKFIFNIGVPESIGSH